MAYNQLISLFCVAKQSAYPLLATFIDFGQKGLAYCTADIKPVIPVIHALGLFPDVGNITNAKRAVEVMLNLYNAVIKNRCDVLVVELQPAINRKMCMLESALAGIFAGDESNRTHGRLIYHHPAWSVKKEFSLPDGYAAKKAAGTNVACRLLANKTQIGMSTPDVLDAMINSKRLHDMSDTILMMVQFSRFLHNCLKYPMIQPISSKRINSNRLRLPATKKKKYHFKRKKQ